MLDPTSSQWREIAAWAEQRLQSARARNDDVELSEAKTAALRGEIRILKELLSLPQKAETRAKLADPQNDAGQPFL